MRREACPLLNMALRSQALFWKARAGAVPPEWPSGPGTPQTPGLEPEHQVRSCPGPRLPNALWPRRGRPTASPQTEVPACSTRKDQNELENTQFLFPAAATVSHPTSGAPRQQTTQGSLCVLYTEQAPNEHVLSDRMHATINIHEPKKAARHLLLTKSRLLAFLTDFQSQRVKANG